MRIRMLCPSSLVAALLILVAVRPPAPSPAADEICPEDQPALAAIDPRLVGLWHRHDAVRDGDPLAFYYFHPAGFGIYRYGRVGLTNTHSFDFASDADTLELRFRKTGVAHAPGYHIEDDAHGTWLVLRGDPREAGAEVRYRRAPDPTHACTYGPLELTSRPSGPDLPSRPSGPDLPSRPSGPDLPSRPFGPDLHTTPGPAQALGGRLWGEEQRYATGGMGFAMYQLQPQAIDGRGVGWYHRGDYDEWLTESLTYRQSGDRITLGFTLRHESQLTALEIDETADGTRTLTLAEDPRDFWRAHTYRDMGPSFATCP